MSGQGEGEASLSGPNFQDGGRVSRKEEEEEEERKERREKNIKNVHTHTHTHAHTCTHMFGGLLIGKVALNAR